MIPVILFALLAPAVAALGVYHYSGYRSGGRYSNTHPRNGATDE